MGLSAIIIFAAAVRPAESGMYSSDGGAIAQRGGHVDCVRPYPPQPENYSTRHDYNTARESYYRLASTYVSNCISEWIEATRRQYMEMYAAEIRAYNEDRQSILDEMRDAANTEF